MPDNPFGLGNNGTLTGFIENNLLGVGQWAMSLDDFTYKIKSMTFDTGVNNMLAAYDSYGTWKIKSVKFIKK